MVGQNNSSSDTNSELKQALLNPSKIFKLPKDVLTKANFSTADKIKILRRWEYDVREMEVAEEENMTADKDSKKVHLDQILDALHTLDKDLKIDNSSPTKHGGE